MEKSISKWAKEHNNRAIGWAHFRKKLKWGTLNCCFVHFEKPFSTVSQKGPRERMAKHGIQNEYQTTVEQTYQWVWCLVKHSTGSPMNLEEFRHKARDAHLIRPMHRLFRKFHHASGMKWAIFLTTFGKHLAILIYADDITLFSRIINSFKHLVHINKGFLWKRSLLVNIG